jgi:hypothetical protein
VEQSYHFFGLLVGSGQISCDPVFTYGPRNVACGGRGFEESMIGLFFDFLKSAQIKKKSQCTILLLKLLDDASHCIDWPYTKKNGKAKPAPAKANKPLATNILRALDMCSTYHCMKKQ